MRTLIKITAALCLVALAFGCNTVKGAGRDIQRGGEKVEDAAASAQK